MVCSVPITFFSLLFPFGIDALVVFILVFVDYMIFSQHISPVVTSNLTEDILEEYRHGIVGGWRHLFSVWHQCKK